MRFKKIVNVLGLFLFFFAGQAHAKREVFVAFSPISHQWWSDNTGALWANSINFDCSLWNASNEQQHVTLTAYWSGNMPLLNGRSPNPAPAPTSLSFTLEPKQAYVWNTSYCAGGLFEAVYCANQTSAAVGVPKGLSIDVQEDKGFITGVCTIYNQSGAGMTSFSIPINAGRPF